MNEICAYCNTEINSMITYIIYGEAVCPTCRELFIKITGKDEEELKE